MAHVECSLSTASDAGEEPQQPPLPPPQKKKRNQPGMPDPEAEVIALSPKSLLATNRFVCEICGKGFQRDQNLQLHRRGHNLPWKLRQRGPTDVVRKRVYVCPEASCVHHDPRRALGDLTGIKKHFCRKHGEKKWKCERCSKKYAVQSDWKAHLKTCGTREYKCDCGTIFSRRDSFVTHRAFCDALAIESAKVQSMSGETGLPGSPPPRTPSSAMDSPVFSTSQSSEMQESTIRVTPISTPCINTLTSNCEDGNESNIIIGHSMFAPLSGIPQQPNSQPQTPFPCLITSLSPLDHPTVYSRPPQALSLCSIYQLTLRQDHLDHHQRSSSMPVPAISATALLQQAAQVGSIGSGSSLLCGFTLNHPLEGKLVKFENGSLVHNGGHPATREFRDPSGFLGSKPTTLDFLGLGIGLGSSSDGDALPDYLTSIGSPLHVAAEFGEERSNLQLQGSWSNDQVAERKPNETVL